MNGTYDIRPSRATDRDPGGAAFARGRESGIAEVMRVVTPAFVFLETRATGDGKAVIDAARKMLDEVTP